MLVRFSDGTNSGQRLDNVNRTHLVLASGMVDLQKMGHRLLSNLARWGKKKLKVSLFQILLKPASGK